MQYNEKYRNTTIIHFCLYCFAIWRSIISQNIMLKILSYQIKRFERLRDTFQTMVFRVGCSLLQGMSPLNIVAT